MAEKTGHIVKCESDSYSFKWIIPNFCYCKNCMKCIESPTFFTGLNNENEWGLSFSGLSTSCFVKLLNSNNRNINSFIVRLTILQKNCEVYESLQEVYDFKSHLKKSFPNFLQTFVDDKCKLGKSLTILCEIADGRTQLKMWEGNKHLSDNFKVILQSKEYSDVTIVVGEIEFHVHRVMLALCSSVFSAMFKHDMKENQQKIVAVTDIDYETMETLLEYIYTGRVKNIDDLTDKLLIAAEKYALEQLKAACSHALIDKITSENVCEMLKLADKYQANDLKAGVLKYISSHQEEVMKMAEYKTVSDLTCFSLKDIINI